MPVKTLTVRSAGGVVMRQEPSKAELEVLLIATHGGSRWALPKGRIERDEDAAEAAVREVAEETGIAAEVVEPIETIEYWFYAHRNVRHHKFVDYYLMRYLAGEPRPQEREVDDARWWPLPEALRRLSYSNDRKVLGKANEVWQAQRSNSH